jgi:hypothetical protein
METMDRVQGRFRVEWKAVYMAPTCAAPGAGQAGQTDANRVQGRVIGRF